MNDRKTKSVVFTDILCYNFFMNKHEKKSHNTHTKICRATLELIETTKYENISVSAICSKAQINRSTFYSHFQNITEIIDVINSGLAQNFLSENNVVCLQTFDSTAFPIDPYMILNRQDLLKFLTFIKKHVRLYAIIVKHQDILRLGLPETDVKHNIFIPSMANLQLLGDEALDYVFDFYVAGLQKILTKWILKGCAEDETEILKIIDVCLYKYTSLCQPPIK